MICELIMKYIDRKQMTYRSRYIIDGHNLGDTFIYRTNEVCVYNFLDATGSHVDVVALLDELSIYEVISFSRLNLD